MSDQSIWEQEAAKGGEQGEWETCPAGSFPASIVGLFDIGTQTEFNRQKNEAYDVRQLILVLELQKNDSKGNHFIKAEKFTWSLRDNSNWCALVTGLTGRKFVEGEKFDPRKLVGHPCMATVVHTAGTTKKGKATTYANLQTIAPYPDGFPIPKDYRPPVIWSVLEGKPLPDVSWVPNVYGKSLETLVENSKEWAAGKVPASATAPRPTNGAAAPKSQIDQTVDAVAATIATGSAEDVPF